MIVWFVLILSIVWISLATALYSNFLPYFSLLSDIKNYNMAYYGANTAIERSLLVLRYQEAWFEGTGGRNKTISNIGDSPASDKWWFWYFDTGDTTLQWTIVSRSDGQAVPWTWRWNTDSYLLSGWSNDWNKLDYRSPQKIPLWVDNTPSDQSYEIDNGDRYSFSVNNIKLHLQLVPSVKEKFSNWWEGDWKLNEDTDGDGDGITNDVIVDRWRKWIYGDGFEFSILPRSLVGSVMMGWDIISLADDESIREDIINTLVSFPTTPPITFWYNFNPLYNNWWGSLKSSQKDTHLMISADQDDLALIDDPSLIIDGDPDNIDYEYRRGDLANQDFTNLLLATVPLRQELNFFLNRNLISIGGGIYPFLQYKIEFDMSGPISQPYFTINGKSQVWDYTVQMNVKKSINKNETLWSFTVVF